MNRLHFRKSHVPSALLIVLISAFGCASTGVDLVEQGKVTVQHLPSHYAHIHRVSVRQEEDMIIIFGELHERTHDSGSVPGHVDIEVISADGDILRHEYTRYHRVGRSKSGKLQFSVEFPGTVPQGSTIRIVHDPVPLLKEPPIFHHPTP